VIINGGKMGKLCECGCGGYTNTPRFIRGHQANWQWRQPEIRASMVRGRKGFTMSLIAKQKISQTLLGHTHLPETKEKIAASLRGRNDIGRGSTVKIEIARRDKIAYSWIHRREIGQYGGAGKSSNTSIEIALQTAMRERGLLFDTQGKILGKPDIFIPDYKMCIFCDGDFYHGNPKFFKATDKQFGKTPMKAVRKKDRKITRELRKKGYTVLRFWESDINTNVNDCVDLIERTLVEQVEESRGVKYEHTE